MFDLQRVKFRTQGVVSMGSFEHSFNISEGVLGSIESTLRIEDMFAFQDPSDPEDAGHAQADASWSPLDRNMGLKRSGVATEKFNNELLGSDAISVVWRRLSMDSMNVSHFHHASVSLHVLFVLFCP